MTDGPRSLVDYIEAPVIVGDPDGRAVYANPCFQHCFGVTKDSLKGTALANLFEGGAREAVLRAVVRVCQGGDAVRFPLRERGASYLALASPILTQEGRVGVLILLTEESSADERILEFQRRFQGELEELERCLTEISGDLESSGADRCRGRLEEAAAIVEQLRKRAGGVSGGC